MNDTSVPLRHYVRFSDSEPARGSLILAASASPSPTHVGVPSMTSQAACLLRTNHVHISSAVHDASTTVSPASERKRI